MGNTGTHVLSALLASLLAAGCKGEEEPRAVSVQASPMLQCYRDIDCKGDRICVEGACSAPAAATAIDVSSGATKAGGVASTESGDIPKFEDYPSGPLYAGPAASLANPSDEYRTLKSAALAANEIVFGSEYVVFSIGCGAGCLFQGFLSKKTGKELEDGFGGEGGEKIKAVRPNSLLVVTAGHNDADEGDPGYYAYFYVLRNGKLDRIAKRKTTLPECVEEPDYCVVESPY